MATVHLLTNPTNEELNHMITIHTKAYAGDNSMKVLLGGDWSLSADLGRAMILATVLEGRMYVVKDKRGQIISFGAWFEPGRGMFSSRPEQRAVGFDDFFKKLKPEIQQWYTHTYPESTRKYGESFFTDEERKHRWWCYNLVTSPKYQSCGYATTIVDHVFNEAKSKGCFVGLATGQPLNVKKYLSMGFRERGSYHIPSPVMSLTNHILSRDMNNGPTLHL